MNFNNMKKDELVDLAVRRFLFNDYLPPLNSEEYNELIDKVKSDNRVEDLVTLLEDNDEMVFEVVPEEFRKHPQSIIRKPYHASINSAGLDIYSPVSATLPPNGSVVIASDISFKFPDNLVCLGNIREQYQTDNIRKGGIGHSDKTNEGDDK